MLLKDYEWQTKRPNDRTENAGGQIVLDFGRYHLSIIDDGYGKEDGLYEIAVYSAENGVAKHQVEMLGITNPNDTVRGYLTEADVNDIINKLYWLSAQKPSQI